MVACMLMAVTLAGCTGATGERDLGSFVEVSGCSIDDGLPEPVFPVATIETNFGTITADIFLNMVPTTAQNFIDIAESGAYDGTSFHRIITDFMMQGGRIDDAVPNIPDEFHRALRHQGAGVLSMANAGPHTGNSQFFITFDDTTWLDDKHSIFGQVTDGFDVLDAVNEQAATTGGTPAEEVVLESVTITYEDRAVVQGFGADLFAYDAEQQVPAGGGWTRFIVVAESLAPGVLPVCFTPEAPEGTTVRIESSYRQLELPAQQRVAVILDVETDGAATVPVVLHGPGGELARLELTVTEGGASSKVVASGDEVEADYIGVTVDGRVFDTSVQEVADMVRDDDLGYVTFQHRGSYSTFSFTPGSGVIQGFTDIAVGTPEGFSNAGRVAPGDAYGERCPTDRPCPPLVGRTLLFQLDVIDIN